MLAVVTGGSGFIGHHLVRELKRRGRRVRVVDIAEPAYGSVADEIEIADLRSPEAAVHALHGAGEVYALAADMGGMGYLSENAAAVLHNNLLIDTNTLEAVRVARARRLFYASSACVYRSDLQREEIPRPLRESDALPAQPDDAYGWEKLTAERLCAEYAAAFGLEVRIARFHNIFGPFGAWDGGREKAPAALCRKIAAAKLTGTREIEIWGDGRQSRSFCYVDDAIEGVMRLMESRYEQPINIGQERVITIDELADLIASIAGIGITKKYVRGPQGVRGRTSDSSAAKTILGWTPHVTLEEGLEHTYAWIESRLRTAESVRFDDEPWDVPGLSTASS